MRFFKILVTLIALTILGGGSVFAQHNDMTYEQRIAKINKLAHIRKKIKVPMRDGTNLSTDIYIPKEGDGPFPTIFWKTPYTYTNMGNIRAMWLLWALERGYALVMQNERGKFFSEGEWEILGLPRTDGYDGLNWIEDQEWSNGNVGTLGCSSSAEWQMGLAEMNHPAHKAMVPMSAGAGIGRVGEFYEHGNFYRGGVPQNFYLPWLFGNQNTQRPTFPSDMSSEDLERLSRHFDLTASGPRPNWITNIWGLPMNSIMTKVGGPKGIYDEFLTRTPDHPDWYEGGLYHDGADFGVPAFWFNTWYDVSISPNLALANFVKENASDPEVRDNQFVLVAPALHCGYYRIPEGDLVVGERNMGDVNFPLQDLVFDWFDYWLKGEENGFLENTPKVQYYTQGENQWNTSGSWPPEGVELVDYYLDSEEGANSLYGDGMLSMSPSRDNSYDSYIYDPMNPVVRKGGGVCCIGGAVQGGSYDQRPTEARQDVLVYSTAPLEEDTNVSGSIHVTLWVSSDVKDTDFAVTLVDVAPDGTAQNLTETIQRARYREGYDKEVFMQEGEAFEIKLTAMSTSNVFKKGHRIRLDVTSSHFPQFSRNLNTGGPNYNETEGVVATNIIHHSTNYPSRITLPILNK